MKKNNKLRKIIQQWWGAPLLAPLLLLPVADHLSIKLTLPSGPVYLYYVPVALFVALLLVFDWAAMPGIICALLIKYFIRTDINYAIALSLSFIIPLALSWIGYRYELGRRNRFLIDDPHTLRSYFIWLVLFYPLTQVCIYQILVTLGAIPFEPVKGPASLWTIKTLIVFQTILTSNLVIVPLIYFLLRIYRKPSFLRVLVTRTRRQLAESVTPGEFLLWIGIVYLIVWCSATTLLPDFSPLSSEYAITLLLPVFIWSAMRYGTIISRIFWAVVVMVVCHYHHGFVNPAVSHQGAHLAFISSTLLVFSLSILLMSVSHTRQRRLQQHYRVASLCDPVTGLANLRCLTRDLVQSPNSILCYIRFFDLDNFGQCCDTQLSIIYKQKLALFLRPYLLLHERIYDLPEYALVLRLDYGHHNKRVTQLWETLQNYRIVWQDISLNPKIGLGYTHISSSLKCVFSLLNTLSHLARFSQLRYQPMTSLELNDNVSKALSEKLLLQQAIHHALDNRAFVMLAQLAEGVRGDNFYEILLRLPNERGELLLPEKFIPQIKELGLEWHIDRYVLDYVLAFMQRHRHFLTAKRFALNLFSSSLSRPNLCNEISEMLQHYKIEPWQLIFEVSESQPFIENPQADYVLSQLRQLGCYIAIDDFGTGYASYRHLKLMQVDMLKIDGSFVRHMLENALDHQIVNSICQVAQLKHIRIVAESVEDEATRTALRAMQVDYMQGYLIGHPVPLSLLAEQQ